MGILGVSAIGKVEHFLSNTSHTCPAFLLNYVNNSWALKCLWLNGEGEIGRYICIPVRALSHYWVLFVLS